MPQPLRDSSLRPASYWQTIRERIDCGAAITLLNRVVNGGECSQAQLQASMFIVNKLLPSLQAIPLDVTDQSANTITDLQAMALEHGVDPTLLLSPDQGISAKLDPPEETPAGGVAPEDEA